MGGFIGKTKTAEISCDISDREYKALLKKITTSPTKEMKKAKDAFSYYLSEEDDDDKPTPISISNIPIEYNEMFDELFSQLKVLKK